MDYYTNDYYGYNQNAQAAATNILAITGIYTLFTLALSVFMIVCMWKIYKKAGKKGWESIIPIYNIIVLLDIVNLPTWYIVLFLIPFANIYVMFKIYIELAHKFGKTTGFGVLTVFFNIICMPILAFGSSSYNGTNQPQISNQPVHQPTQQPVVEQPQQTVEPNNASTPIDFQQQPQNNIIAEERRFCSNCGNKVETEDLFCNNCGNKL